MLKLIIVDDEEYVINGLIKHINWNALGIEVVATAPNGSIGFEKIMQYTPDIVMADIKMPVMDGLEMIRKSREAGVKCKFIVLSGYGEFEYAKKGIKYGVVDYILKPSMPEEIIKIFKKVVDSCLEEQEKELQEKLLRERLKKSIPVLTEKFVEELLEGNISNEKELMDKAQFLSLDIINKQYRVLTLQIDSYNDFIKYNSEEEKQLRKISILSKACQLFNVYNTYLNFKERNCYLLLISDNKNPKWDQDISIKKAAEWLIDDIYQNFKVSLSVGVGEPVNDLRRISDSYFQSKECLNFKLQFGNGKVIFYEDIVYTQLNVPVLDLYSKDDLITGLKTRDKERVFSCINGFISKIKECKGIMLEYVKLTIVEMIGIVSLTLYQIGEKESVIFKEPTLWCDIDNIETIDKAEMWLRGFFEAILDSISKKNNQRITRTLDQIIEYIHENYNKEITIEDISRKIYLTPNYLSNIFSKNVGESFTKYLVRYRIEKAKELLNLGVYKIYEISEMVGYKNTDYFSKIFKEYVGVTPSEY